MKAPSEEVIHGITVRDPFRWLEDRTLPETAAWVEEQRRRLDDYFASIPDLGLIEGRVRRYLDVEVLDQPARIGNVYFYRKRERGEQQGRICIREGGDERILFDPSRRGMFTSADLCRISGDGASIAISVRHGGADQTEIHLLDVHSGRPHTSPLPAGLSRGLVFSPRGCFWCHEVDANCSEHRIHYLAFDGGPRNDVVFRVPRTTGSRLVLTGTESLLGALLLRPLCEAVIADFWVSDLVDGVPGWNPLFRGKHMPYSPILWHHRVLVVVENPAGNPQIVELSREGVERTVWAFDMDCTVRQVIPTKNRLFVSYFERGRFGIAARQLNGGSTGAIGLPGAGTVEILPSPSVNPDSFFYRYESFDVPPRIYENDANEDHSIVWHQQDLPDDHRETVIREVTFASEDGTRIPLTLVASRGDGAASVPRPVLMTSYGGFGVVLTPRFSVLASVLLEFGVLLALPHIRGGGEFGKAWHEAGRRRNRQTSFDDFIAAAEWLVGEGITIQRQIGIFGGSNSGLLVAAAMTQRPDLFGAVLSIAPLLDMVRYEALEGTARWRHEYGSVEDRDDFRAILRYSPYHRVEDSVSYPATLLVTGDKDERCPAAHVRKMAARLQQRAAQRAQILVDHTELRGHAPAMPLSVRISALVRRIAFLCQELGIAVPQGRLS